MKIFVKAKPRAKEEKIQKIDENHYIISVKEPPIQGKANEAIVRVLAEYFKTARAKIKILSGYSSKEKTIEIL